MNVQRGPMSFSTVSGPVPARLASAVRGRVAQFGIPGGIGVRARDATAVDDPAINVASAITRTIPAMPLEVGTLPRRRIAPTI
jgi:hypothetical protein